MFQFHLVRLKAEHRLRKRHDGQFQFHLVRLKVHLRVVNRIHQQFQFHLVRLKGVFVVYERKDGTLFQFHLVRLKEDRGRIHIHGIFVSIPFSTIKSHITGYYKDESFLVSIPFSTIKSI